MSDYGLEHDYREEVELRAEVERLRTELAATRDERDRAREGLRYYTERDGRRLASAQSAARGDETR